MHMRALSKDEVHVWCADPRAFELVDTIVRARVVLSADEIERYERFHFERDRAIYLATHWLARTVLSRYEPVEPASWRFVAGKYGRPEIDGDSKLRFNLSNTHGLVVCAVTHEVDVGVDVETTRRPAPLDIVDRFFAPAEIEAFGRLPVADRPRRFFDYWTLKESYIKARGFGISLPLDRFAFVLEKGRAPRIEIDPSVGDRADRWQFLQYEPTSEHLLALCVERPTTREATVTFEWSTLEVGTSAPIG